MTLARRGFLAGTGLLMLGFSLAGRAASAADGQKLPGDLAATPDLDSWIRIDAAGRVMLLTGKVELGQGVLTALMQLCAEELSIAPGDLAILSGDTAFVPNEGGTVGSMSIPYGGAAVRQAAAEVRTILIELAAARWKVGIEALAVDRGNVIDSAGRQLSYGVLIGGRRILRRATGTAKPVRGTARLIVGKPTPRRDLPDKIAGREAYLQDLRLPGMLHARVIRPPMPGATLVTAATSAIEIMPGVTGVIRDGDFLAVVADGQWHAIVAAERLAHAAHWRGGDRLPTDAGITEWLLTAPADIVEIAHRPRSGAEAPHGQHGARYTRPYHMHGAIGPSVAIAELRDGLLTVWTHSQTVFDTRNAIAELVGLPNAKVRCRHVQGAGCYGHNGADDAAGDAALLAMKLPGRPIRVQWSREDEHANEPYGSAMTTRLSATVDARGDVLDWTHDLWSMPHNTRPSHAGNLLVGRAIAKRFKPPRPELGGPPNYTADRNAIPYYAFPGQRVTTHFIVDQPLRASSTRSLGAFANVFSIESFVDELARRAGVDPVLYRLRQLIDPRAKEVIERTAARFGWRAWGKSPGRGRGMAFARYKNLVSYCAVMIEVAVDPTSRVVRLVRAAVSVDAGEVVNPDGLANQIEGGLIQGLSWALKEQVRFDEQRVLSRDWETYPILTLGEAPTIEVEIVDRPGEPFLGAGEASQGPGAAALANAVADACGARVRDLPLSPAAIERALAAA